MWPCISLALLAVFLLPFASALSQHTTTRPDFQPEAVRKVLLQGEDVPRARLARALRLRCTDFDFVNLDYVALRKPGPQAVIVAGGSDCAYSALAVLERDQSGRWGPVDTLSFRFHDAAPQVNFQSLIVADTKEIVVHHEEEDHGTGIVKLDMTIYRLTRNGLELVFDEPEHLVFAVPSNDSGDQPELNTEEYIDSEFQFVRADTHDATSLQWIEQKETIRQHKTVVVLYWRFIWDPETQRFQSVAYSP